MKNMKRVIISVIAVFLVVVGWSQTLTIKFKDGSVTNQYVGNITSFEITEDNTEDNQDNDNNNNQAEDQELKNKIVGTWIEATDEETWFYPGVSLGITYIQFNNDGTWFSVKIDGKKIISKGRWHILDNNLIVNTKEGRWTFYPTKWNIKTINSKELVLSFEKITATLEKVKDSEIEKLLPSDFNRSFYCKGQYDIMEDNSLTIDGKKYYASRNSSVSEEGDYYNDLSIMIVPDEDILTYTYTSYKRQLVFEISGGYVHDQTVGDVKKPHRVASYGGWFDNCTIDEGSVSILEITNYYLTIKLDNIKVRIGSTEHIYDGIVTLVHDLFTGSSPSEPVPFEKSKTNEIDTTPFELKKITGTWTTVAVNDIPSSQTEGRLINYTFNVYYDGGYTYESDNVGDLTLENSIISLNRKPLMEVLSFDGTNLKVRVNKFDNAVLTMKKLGTLNDEDYINKITNGVWIDDDYNSDKYEMSYQNLSVGETIKQIASSHGNNFRMISFYKDGTGESYRGSSGYKFDWSFSNKTITIKRSSGTAMSTKMYFIGIEGTLYLKYEYNSNFSWD